MQVWVVGGRKALVQPGSDGEQGHTVWTGARTRNLLNQSRSTCRIQKAFSPL